MLAKILSGTLLGLEGVLVEVEVEVVDRGLPSFKIVGLPDKAVEEARERVRSAILNSGAKFPEHRIVVNLAPADLPKRGPAFDLPIALGILVASGQVKLPVKKIIITGELSLDGAVRSVPGVLSLARLAQVKKIKSFFVPVENAPEARLVSSLEVYPVKKISQLVGHLQGLGEIGLFLETKQPTPAVQAEFDLSEIKGQEQAKRAVEIAVAGGHNLFLRGVPGAGKTMLARAIPGLMPPLSEKEALEVTQIYSIVGKLSAGSGLVTTRPFRSPHHSVSKVGMVGGGSNPRPGEVTLAHRGVLFLDELAEFPRGVIEALRQPLEDGRLSISRAAGRVEFPSKFMLVAASNPCPCGWLGSERKNCHCSASQVMRYQHKLSGPILDRIDLHVEVDSVPVEKLTNDQLVSESSESVRRRVVEARERQLKRTDGKLINARLNPKQLKKHAFLSREPLLLLKEAVIKLGLTARGYNKVIKISRTIADLAGRSEIRPSHIAEALQYRPKE